MLHCPHCGGKFEEMYLDQEPEKIIDMVPYGEGNVPMESWEGENIYVCSNCGKKVYDDELIDYPDLEPEDVGFLGEVFEGKKNERFMEIMSLLADGQIVKAGELLQKEEVVWNA